VPGLEWASFELDAADSTTDGAKKKGSINLVVIQASELEASKHFYEALGLHFTAERHDKGPEHYAAELGGLVFELYPAGDKTPTTGVRLGISVPSIARAVAEVERCGASVASPPADSPWGPRAVVIDPDGNRVELTE